MQIADRYPELTNRIERIHAKLISDASIQMREVYEIGYIPGDLKMARRSFWKIQYPYFRSWDKLQLR